MSRTPFAALAALMAASTLSAHTGPHTPLGGLGDGLLHPLTGIDHLLALTALGVWSALGGPGQGGRMLAWLSAGLLGGAFIGMGTGGGFWLELAIAASVLGIGLLIAFHWSWLTFLA